MTCDGCRSKVEKTLNTVSGIEAKVTLNPPTATITMNEHVPIAKLQKALSVAGNYTITDDNDANVIPNADKATTKSCCNSDEHQNKETVNLSNSVNGKYYCPMHCEGEKHTITLEIVLFVECI